MKGGYLDIMKFLPDVPQISQLIESIFKTEEAPEILTIVSNLVLSIDTTLRDDWEMMVCDREKFQQFKFPDNTDRLKIQQHLCSLIRFNTSFIENVLTTFDLNAVIAQMKVALAGNIGEEDVWQYAIREVEMIANSLMDMPNMFMGINWQNIEHVQTSLMTTLKKFFASHEQKVDELCNAVTPYIENTEEYKLMWPMLHYSIIAMEMEVDFVRLMPGLVELLCDLPSLNLMKLGQHLKDTNMWGLINTYIDKWNNPDKYDVKCSAFPRIMNEMAAAGNETVMKFMMHPIDARQCFDKFLEGPVSMFNDVNNIFDVIAGFQSIIGNQDLLKLLNMKELHPVFDFILKVLLQQKAVATSFSSIFANATSIEEILLQTFSLLPDVVNTLFESTINLDLVKLLDKNAADLEKIFCDPVTLGQYMTLPAFSKLTIMEISDHLCKPSIMAAVINAIDVTKTLEQISSLGLNSEFITRLTTHIMELISKVEDLKSLQSFYGMLTNLDLSMLNITSFRDVFPQVQKILLQSGPDEIIKSISAILGDFKMLSDDPMLNSVIDSMELFIKGLMGLDVVKHFIPDILLMSDIFPNTDEMKTYMVETLGISQEVADALMNSSISYIALLDLYNKNLTGLLCDPAQASQLFILNTTKDVTLADISAALCTMNASMAEKLADALLKQLDIGDLMQQYVQLGGDTFLENAGISKDEAKATFLHLIELSKDLGSIASSLRNLTQNIDVETLSTVAEFQSGAAAMVTLGPLLCGKQVDFVISGEIFTNNAKRKRRNIDESAIFCEDFYAQFQAMKNGGIVWKYVKPLILGKILFTPNNTETWQVIQQANSTFQALVDIKEVADAWAGGVTLLRELLDKSSSLDSISEVLQSSFVDSLLQQTIGVSGSEVMQAMSTASNFDQRQIQLLEAITKLISQYVSCVEADRFLAFDTEKELAAAALKLNEDNLVMAGLVFLDMEESTKSQRKINPKTDLSKHIKYKIRFDLDNVMRTSGIRDLFWRPSPEDSFSLQLRYLRGFLQLQEMIERAVIEIQTDSNLTSSPGVYLQEFPFPCHKNDIFLFLISSYLLPAMMTIAWLATLALAIRNLMYDREGGQEEVLKVMGLRGGINWMAWFLTTFFFMVVVSIVSSLILKYGGVLQHTNLLILFLYLCDFCLSTLMMGYMVSSFFTRGTIAVLTGLIIFLLSYLPFILLVSFEIQLVLWHKLLASLLSTTGFSFGAIILSRYEQQLIGVQWSNTNLSPAINDEMSFTWACVMMLIDSVIYFIIGWYVRNIKPGKYGIAQPWYFPFSPTYWGCKRASASSRYESNGIDADENLLFEKYGQDFPVGIAIQHLSKKYKNKLMAVNNLDMQFYEGQITSILGQNGAGKTTTLNMLTGIISPTSGTALISNNDIRTDLRKVRSSIGICTQHNTLFDFMSVEEHLSFCAGIKAGWTGSKLRHEIRSMLRTVDLWHMRHVPARNLSGGMKRRLCIAIAFVGGSQTIILDEPTSGIDPKARRSIWDLILKHRIGKIRRTIVLSTHMMEEADILSDRVAILHHGRLLCCGSPLFLKRQLGSGYRLSMEKMLPAPEATCKIEEPSTNGLCNSATVLSFIHRSVPTAILVEEVGTEMTFVLPLQDNTTAGFHHLFQTLDGQLENLHIASYGVSDTTLEEVFLKICALADDGKPLTVEYMKAQRFKPVEIDDAQTDDTDSTTDSLTTMASKNTLKSGMALKFQQFSALFVKRFHHFRRNWRMFITLIFLPCVFFTIAMGLAVIQPKTSMSPSLELTPAMYGPNSYTFQQDNVNSDFTDRVFNSMLIDPGLSTTCMANERDAHECVKPGTAFVRPSSFTYRNSSGCKCNDFKQTCEPGASGLIPRQRVTTTTEIMQDLNNRNITDYLLSSFSNFTEKRYGGFSFEKDSLTSGNGPYLKLWFNNKGWHALPAFSNAYSNALLRSHIDGTTDNPEDYGITVYNHPLILGLGQIGVDTLIQKAADTGITLVFLMAFTFIPAGLVTYIVKERVNMERQLQQTNGVGILLYWITSFTWDGIIFMIPVAICAGIIAIFQLSMFWYGMNMKAVMLLLTLFGWSSIPFMYCFLRLFKNSTTAYIVLVCLSILLGLGTTVTNFLLKMFINYPDIAEAYYICHYVFMILPQYAFGAGLVELKVNQMVTDIMMYFNETVYKDPFSKDMLYWNYVALTIQGLFFFILAIIIDACYRARARFSLEKPEYIKEEEDVSIERRRVEAGQNNFDILSVKNLSKVYRRGLKKVLAVDHITFGIPKGECFGLLGVNGAGKTTTFKMLTGSTIPSGGSANLLGRDLITNDDMMRKHVGYCPQFDALDMYLTGREMLTCYARLKGIPSSVIDQMVPNLINRMKLITHADKIVNTYSGGYRRKLSVAIAFLGDPDILLLDEPTTGMDPGTRRYAWNIISSAIRKQQAVILTSHSMEECDALCTRLAMMVNGRFVCLGSPQHLKNKYSQGYTITIKAHLMTESVSRFIQDSFPQAILKEHHNNMLCYTIPRDYCDLASMFAVLEHSRHDLHYDYSISQTTLERVFVNFAQDQSDGTVDDSDTSSYSETSSTDNSNSLSSQSQRNVAIFNNPIYARGVSLEDVKDMDLKYSDPLQRKQLPSLGIVNPSYDALDYDQSTYL